MVKEAEDSTQRRGERSAEKMLVNTQTHTQTYKIKKYQKTDIIYTHTFKTRV